jgi:iron(III) transport system substrate-binding protein
MFARLGVLATGNRRSAPGLLRRGRGGASGRRTAFRLVLSLVLAVLAPSLVARAADPVDQAAKLEAAKKEGKVVWYVSMFDIDTAEQVGKAFEKKYPGVQVQVVRATAGVIYQRVLQESEAGVFADDVFSSTEEGHYLNFKDKKLIRPYLPVDADKVVERFQRIDKDNAYQVASVGVMLLVHNTQQVSAADKPKNWKDLLDPKWKDKIAFGHPAFSGYIATWVLSLNDLYGWDYFEKLAKQNPLIGRSANDAITQLSSGERIVAAGSDATTLKAKDRGNPVDITYPEDGVVFMTAPSAILTKAPHPHAAELFMDFFMSVEYSELLARNGFAPMRPGVEPPKGMRPLSEVKLIRPPAAELKTEIPKIIEKFRNTFGI